MTPSCGISNTVQVSLMLSILGLRSLRNTGADVAAFVTQLMVDGEDVYMCFLDIIKAFDVVNYRFL